MKDVVGQQLDMLRKASNWREGFPIKWKRVCAGYYVGWYKLTHIRISQRQARYGGYWYIYYRDQHLHPNDRVFAPQDIAGTLKEAKQIVQQWLHYKHGGTPPYYQGRGINGLNFGIKGMDITIQQDPEFWETDELGARRVWIREGEGYFSGYVHGLRDWTVSENDFICHNNKSGRITSCRRYRMQLVLRVMHWVCVRHALL